MYSIRLLHMLFSRLLMCIEFTAYLQAYQSVLQLVEARATYRSLKIPMIVIPSTISNNVPGTDFSLGTDTSLNEIVSVSKLIHVLA